MDCKGRGESCAPFVWREKSMTYTRLLKKGMIVEDGEEGLAEVKEEGEIE